MELKETDLNLIEEIVTDLKAEAKLNFEEAYFLIYEKAINDFLEAIKNK